MEYRKLIKFGNSSYVISIPKDWIKKNNITKGDTVYFEENDKNELVVSSSLEDKSAKRKIVTINIDGLNDREIELEIISNYVKDFNRIIITGANIEKKHNKIRKILHDLVAIEVIEQKKRKIVAKDFLNIKEIHLKDLQKRLNTVITSMFNDSKFGQGKENYESVINRDYDANKFTYIILRVIRRGLERPNVGKSIGLTPLELMHTNYATLAMERVADLAKRISRIDKNSTFTKKEIIELNKIHEKALANYKVAVKSFLTKNYEDSCNVFVENRSIQNECDKIRGNLKNLEAFKATHLLRELSTNISLIGEAGFMNVKSTKSTTILEEIKD